MRFTTADPRLLASLVFLLGLFSSFSLGRPFAAQSEAKLTATDPAPSTFFGLPVATDGNTVAVGATFDNQAGTRAGAVYVFAKSNGEWAQEAKLIGSDTAAEDQFGFSVAVSGGMLAVGVPLHDAGATTTGAVYIFRRDDGIWLQQAKLIAGDAAENTGLGSSVAISGSTIAVGAVRSEAVYVFQETETGWVETAKLKASDAGLIDRFGTSVALTSNTLMVGASEHNSQAGAVYLFERHGDWQEVSKLVPDDSAAGDQFGRSVSVSGGTAVIGAPFNDEAVQDAGAAYIFRRGKGGWHQEAKLTASDGAPSDFFGFTVSISGNSAVVGAPFDDDAGLTSGSVYVFERGAAWQQVEKLTASDAAAGDQFGRSVSVSGESVVVGAHLNDEGATNSGAAYVFNLPAGGK